MAVALGPHISRRSPEATLLHHAQGKLDPEVARASRLFKFWLRELPGRTIPEAYWRVCHQDRFRGPLHTLRRLMLKYGIESTHPQVWTIGHTRFELPHAHGLLQASLEQVRAYLWGKLSRVHTVYQGMHQGRDELKLQKQGPGPRDQSFVDVLRTHTVYTPWLRIAVGVGARVARGAVPHMRIGNISLMCVRSCLGGPRFCPTPPLQSATRAMSPVATSCSLSVFRCLFPLLSR